MVFQLDPKLEQDSTFICDLTLCHIRLSHNAAFPWILLIPKRANIIEIIDLTEADQLQLLKEIREACYVLKKLSGAKKLHLAIALNVS